MAKGFNDKQFTKHNIENKDWVTENSPTPHMFIKFPLQSYLCTRSKIKLALCR